MQARTAALSIVLVAAICGTARAGKIEVPRDYPTIQQAVDAAGSGDTIVVREGGYAESVSVIDKTRLTIRGVGEPTIIAGGAERAISITGSTTVKIEGLVVQGARDGVSVVESKNVLVKDCTIRAASRDGLVVSSSTKVKLWASLIEDVGDDGAEFLEGATRCSVGKSTLRRCGDSGLIFLGDRNKISKNDITDCGDDGVRFWGERNVAIRNVIASCQDDGFDVFRGVRNTFKKNRLSDLGQYAFQIDEGDGYAIVRNVVESSDRAGALIEQSAGKFVKNRISDCGRFGIEVTSGGNVVTGNVISGSGEFDVFEAPGLTPPNIFKKNKTGTTNVVRAP